MDVKSKIGKRIKTLRGKLKISQLDLSLISQLDRTYITSVENGKRNLSIVNLEKIATALNTTLKEFFNCDTFDTASINKF